MSMWIWRWCYEETAPVEFRLFILHCTYNGIVYKERSITGERTVMMMVDVHTGPTAGRRVRSTSSRGPSCLPRHSAFHSWCCQECLRCCPAELPYIDNYIAANGSICGRNHTPYICEWPVVLQTHPLWIKLETNLCEWPFEVKSNIDRRAKEREKKREENWQPPTCGPLQISQPRSSLWQHSKISQFVHATGQCCEVMYICLTARISKKPHNQTSPYFVHAVAVDRYSCGNVVIFYVLPVLWMTSWCLHTMGSMLRHILSVYGEKTVLQPKLLHRFQPNFSQRQWQSARGRSLLSIALSISKSKSQNHC